MSVKTRRVGRGVLLLRRGNMIDGERVLGFLVSKINNQRKRITMDLSCTPY